MLKLIIFSLLGKNIVSSRVLFNSIKSYLIIYMMILPAFLNVGVLANHVAVQESNSVLTEIKAERDESLSCRILPETVENMELLGNEYAVCHRPVFSPALRVK